ncbi:MAG: GGDEF domain-containing protein [Lachnospiraceae bacterium]|nr:GGDEF domain-containing protein [Lachnospiraceae bacterium]
MDEKNCELLFQYLKSILYDSKVKTLDLTLLDEPYQKLGMGLAYLEEAVVEMKAYSSALSTGRLSAPIPPRENFLCENLKNIHANLNHLTWQAKQVAKGDYSQHVSYLGEFSEAFNTMTQQLRERELSLKQEAEKEKQHAKVSESYNQLLLELIGRSDEEIMVVGREDHSILYCNENSRIRLDAARLSSLFEKKLKKDELERISDRECVKWTWEAEDESGSFYHITTGLMEWQGKTAYAHIIREVTEEKKLEEEAHHDPLTGIWNRHYFQEKARELLETGEELVFGYCDLDHLKYVNDHYGHREGDWYLCHFTECVKHEIRTDDIFARIGGDEFCMILRGCPKQRAEERMIRILARFRGEESLPASDQPNKESHFYPKSFSWGTVEIPQSHGPIEVEEIIHQADGVMYRQKRAHKETYRKELQ